MFYFAGAISGRPFSVPLSPLLSRLCRQLLSRGALLIPLLDERCTHCRSDGCYSASFFCSPITTPQSTLSTAPLYGSLTNTSPQGEVARSVGVVAVIRRPFSIFQHVKASRYGLPYLLICCTCVSCVIRCFLSVTAAETRI